MATVTNCAREAPRINMFVMAVMSAGALSGPIKIRNLSSTGALVEGSSLPAVGARVTLRRGESAVSGTIIWSVEGKAGLKSDSHIEVASWMPGNPTHQNKIDDVIERVRNEKTKNLIAPATKSSAVVSAPDLVSLADAICLLADGLAGDNSIVERFAQQLQTLDLAAQIFRKLAEER